MELAIISGWDGAADALRSARQARGLSVEELAGRTRIPSWHLESIEDSRFDALPAPIFAVGFAKSFARAVGVPEEPIATAVRAGLDERRVSAATEARVANRRLIGLAGTFAVAAVLALLILLP